MIMQTTLGWVFWTIIMTELIMTKNMKVIWLLKMKTPIASFKTIAGLISSITLKDKDSR